MKLAFQNKSKLYIALITTLISLIILVTGTYAWFTLSLSGKVNTMELQVTGGDNLYISTTNLGSSVENWIGHTVVSNAAIEAQTTYDLDSYSITPVTSKDSAVFYNENATEIVKADKEYLQFDLYFYSTKNVTLKLTEENSSDGNDGTLVAYNASTPTGTTDIEKCIRVGLAPASGTAKIYEPNKNGTTALRLPASKSLGSQTTYEAPLSVCSLTANTPTCVTVTVWLEGNDSDCDDDVQFAKFDTRLRFIGE